MSQFVSQVLPLLDCFFVFLFSLLFLLFNNLALSQKVLHEIHNVDHLSFTHKLKILLGDKNVIRFLIVISYLGIQSLTKKSVALLYILTVG